MDDDDIQPIAHFDSLPIPDEELEPIVANARLDWHDDGEQWFGSVPGFEGAWVTGDTPDQVRHELLSVLRDWISARVQFGQRLPEMPTVHLDRYVAT